MSAPSRDTQATTVEIKAEAERAKLGVAGGESVQAVGVEETGPRDFRTVIIEGVSPQLDDGRYPIKREVGETLRVEADIFKEGHDLVAARVLYRGPDDGDWRESAMSYLDNDRWAGSFLLEQNGRYRYTVEATPDVYRSWAVDTQKKADAAQDLAADLLEGSRLLREAADRAAAGERAVLLDTASSIAKAADQLAALRLAVDPVVIDLVSSHADMALVTRYDRELEVVVDREEARFAAWYEIFVRSQGTVPGKGATFRDAERRLPAIQAMGFDVLYLTPIHPIGLTNRKGPNNSLVSDPDDPGSPYAIGSAAGGHTAVEPSLGTLDDFDRFQQAARSHGMELAMDFAIQVSPDHPWVTEHPEWFYRRPDGSIKFAENPPKKYEDIYPLNFYNADWRGLWQELKSVVHFWIRHGVRTFRVDNPHTKPLDFWVWLIREVQRDHPDVVFLSEAFTRPKVMKALAKAGFTQSYTYFTWRNHKRELAEYLTEITSPPVAEYFRGNLFTNTPDILTEVLQTGGRPAFIMRLVLAATCSSVYGIYNGFELCEARARPGTEVYADSEMYQHKVWDWDRSGNIVDVVTRINTIRRQNPALQLYRNLRFYESDNEHILFYGKATPDLDNRVLVAVNLDPFSAHDSWVHVPIEQLGIDENEAYELRDLLNDARYTWHGRHNWVRLDPQVSPAHIFRVGTSDSRG